MGSLQIEICASLNHRKKTKADGSQLIPGKLTETLVLFSVFEFLFQTPTNNVYVKQTFFICCGI